MSLLTTNSTLKVNMKLSQNPLLLDYYFKMFECIILVPDRPTASFKEVISLTNF